MDIEVLLESFDGAFATNTLRDYRKADNGRYQTIFHAQSGQLIHCKPPTSELATKHLQIMYKNI